MDEAIVPQTGEPSTVAINIRPFLDGLPFYSEFELLDNDHDVVFFHPGYTPDPSTHDPYTELLRLPAYDNGGLHHGTALSALAILACNEPGYLTIGRPNGPQVYESWDYILPANKHYYYNLYNAHAPAKYSICESFSAWVFNVTVIPQEWIRAFDIHTADNPTVTPSSMSDGVHLRDHTCRLSGFMDAAENTHIIPRSEWLWFGRNGMHQFNFTERCLSNTALNDVQNGFLLRRDLHFVFDQKIFCFVVKMGEVVAHFVRKTGEMGALYHNRRLRVSEAKPPVEFFWSRFAWTVLGRAGGFQQRQLERVGHLVLTTKEGQEGDQGTTPKPKRKKQDTGTAKGKGRGRGRRTGAGAKARAPNPVTAAATRPRRQHTTSSTPLDPRHVPKSQLERESARDRDVRQKLFPRMGGETSWSNEHTWQHAQWYPGIDQMDRVKNWWKKVHPQVSETGGSHFAELEDGI